MACKTQLWLFGLKLIAEKLVQEAVLVNLLWQYNAKPGVDPSSPDLKRDSFFSSPCQSQCELLPSLGVRRPITFKILILSSETPQPNEVKLGRKALSKDCSFGPDPSTNMATIDNSCF